MVTYVKKIAFNISSVMKSTTKLRWTSGIRTTMVILILMLCVHTTWKLKRAVDSASAISSRTTSRRALRENCSLNDLFLYFENPPAACYKPVKLGGETRRGLHDIVTKDGDKIICEDPAPSIPKNNCIIYSFGSALEFSFEIDAYKRYGCDIHTFDPSIAEEKLEGNVPTFVHMHSIGIAHKDGYRMYQKWKWELKSLASIVKLLGHEKRRINILKMDIEGSEWSVLQSLIGTKVLQKVDHLSVETHFKGKKLMLKLMPALEDEGFQLFSARGNPSVALTFFPQLNEHKPRCYELSYYRV